MSSSPRSAARYKGGSLTAAGPLTPASKLRKAGVFSRVDDSNTSIGKRYARNDELGTPFGLTLDFACTCSPRSRDRRARAHPPSTRPV